MNWVVLNWVVLKLPSFQEVPLCAGHKHSGGAGLQRDGVAPQLEAAVPDWLACGRAVIPEGKSVVVNT